MNGGLLRGPLRSVVRHYPLYSGGASLVQRDPFRRLTPAGPVAAARLRDGAQLLVRSDDFIGRSILLTGDYDPKLTWLCRRILRPGDTVLDVGANQGVVTAYAAGLVGAGGTVHAFEPQRDLAALIERSMVLNGYRQVTVHAMALSAADERRPLYGRPASSPTASLEASESDGAVLDVVPVRRAGAVFAELELGPIRLLKLDVEGHEEPFLRGCLEYLADNPPAVLAFESHGDEPFRRRPVVAILAELGYRFFQIPKARLSMRLMPLDGDRTGPGFDYVALARRSGLAARLT